MGGGVELRLLAWWLRGLAVRSSHFALFMWRESGRDTWSRGEHLEPLSLVRINYVTLRDTWAL